jgi:hypothetical protein
MAAWAPYMTAKRLCCMALILVFLPQCKAAWDTPRIKRVARFMVLLVGVQVLAGIGSHDPLGAIKYTFGDIVEMYLPLLIGAHLFRTKQQVRTLLTLVLISMGIIAVLGIIEHAADYNFYDNFVAVRTDIQGFLQYATESHRHGDIHARRIRVAFPHPIELGLHLMCAFLTVIYFFSQRGLLRRIVLFASLPVFALAMMYTFSRGPLLGLACGLVWLGVVGRGVRSLLPLIILCCASGFLLMPSQSRNVLQETVASSADISTGDSMGGGTVRARLNLFQFGLELSKKNIWFGMGPGAVKQQRVSYYGGVNIQFTSIDNYYLQTLLWHGAVVLALTLALYTYLLGFFTRAALRLADRELALLAALAASICVANFVALFTVGFNITLFWILLGPALRLCDMGSSPGPHRSPRRGRLGTGRQLMGRGQSAYGPTPAVPAAAGVGGDRSSALAVAHRPACRARSWRPEFITAAFGLLCIALSWPSPCQAAPSFYGTTGLYETPVAGVAPRGSWSLGTTYVGRDYRPGASSISPGTVANAFTVTLLPRLELGIVLTNFEGKLGVRRRNRGLSADYGIAGYTVDRSAMMQWLVVTQKGSRPSMAVGVRDLFGIQQLQQAQYGVTSFRRGRLQLSAGLGTKALHGVFGGAEFAITPRVTSIVEQLHGQWNGGFRLMPLRDFQLDAALMGFRSLGGGLSYRRRF